MTQMSGDTVYRRIYLCRPSRAVSFGLTIRRYRLEATNEHLSQIEHKKIQTPSNTFLPVRNCKDSNLTSIVVEESGHEKFEQDLVIVTSVQVNSYAYYAGIKVDDEIVAVNGCCDFSFEQICDLVKSVSCRIALDVISRFSRKIRLSLKRKCLMGNNKDADVQVPCDYMWNESLYPQLIPNVQYCHFCNDTAQKYALPYELLSHSNEDSRKGNCQLQKPNDYENIIGTYYDLQRSTKNQQPPYKMTIGLCTNPYNTSMFVQQTNQRSSARLQSVNNNCSSTIKTHCSTVASSSTRVVYFDQQHKASVPSVCAATVSNLKLSTNTQQSQQSTHHSSRIHQFVNSPLCTAAAVDNVQQCERSFKANSTNRKDKITSLYGSSSRHYRNPIIKEGFVQCKLLQLGEKKTVDRSWHTAYAVLHRNRGLFLCKGKNIGLKSVVTKHDSCSRTIDESCVYVKRTNHSKSSNDKDFTFIPLNSDIPFPLAMGGDSGMRIQLALDYKKKQRVFRLTSRTSQQPGSVTELLIHTSDLQSLCEWLYELRKLCWRNSGVSRFSSYKCREGKTADYTHNPEQKLVYKSSTRPLERNLSADTAHHTRLSHRTEDLSNHLKSTVCKPPANAANSSSNNLPLPTLSTRVSQRTGTPFSLISKRKLSTSPLIRRGMAGCLRRGILGLGSSHDDCSLESKQSMMTTTTLTKTILTLSTDSQGSSQLLSSSGYNTSTLSEMDHVNFGVPLHQCEQSKVYPGVPLVVVILTKLIEAFGVRNVGVYRQSGSVQTTNWLIEQLNTKPLSSIDYTDIRWQDIKAITSALKAFFSRLPECIFGQDLYAELLESVENLNEDNKKGLNKQIVCLLRRMNANAKTTLAYLLNHLKIINSMSEFNRGDVKNIAIIFGPTLLWHPGRELEQSLADNPKKIQLLETLLDNNEFFIQNMMISTNQLSTVVNRSHAAATTVANGVRFDGLEALNSFDLSEGSASDVVHSILHTEKTFC